MKIILAKDVYCGVVRIYELPKDKWVYLEPGMLISTRYERTDGSMCDSMAFCVSEPFQLKENSHEFNLVSDTFKGIIGNVMGYYEYYNWEPEEKET